MSNSNDCDLLNILTTYKHDYDRKKLKFLPQKYNSTSEFQDPINEAFRDYLDVVESTEDKIENAESYFEKAKDRYKWFSKVFKDKFIDENVVKNKQMYNNRTIYQVDYCDIEKELKQKLWEKENAVVLPYDIKIPLTTQKSSYREPIKLNSRAYEREKEFRIPELLRPDPKIRKILNTKTGDSEYMGHISKLGKLIIEEQIHGEIKREKASARFEN